MSLTRAVCALTSHEPSTLTLLSPTSTSRSSETSLSWRSSISAPSVLPPVAAVSLTLVLLAEKSCDTS